MMMMDQRPDREVIFLSGVDPTTINESDIRDFFKQVTRSDVLVRFHYYSVVSKPRCTVEVTLPPNDAMNALQKLNGYRLKNCTIKLTPRNSMKALILNNIPAIICEKDLFAMLARSTPGLKRIIMADDPEICGKTLGLAVASYENFEAARSALDRLKTFKLLERQIIATWKDPNYDVIGELALDTRVIYIKNISGQTTIDRIREILSAFGNVLTIKKMADRAFVEFDDMKSARRAMEHCQGRRFAGLEWRIYPAKKLDIEKAKETADKNVIFSKGFLDESDQNVLMGFAFGGVFPQVDPSAIQKAAEITENARKMQAIICEHYRSQYEERLTAKQQVVNKIDNQENVNPLQQKPESIKPVVQVQAKIPEKVVPVQVQPQVKPQMQPQVQPRGLPQAQPQVQPRVQPQVQVPPQIQIQVQQSKEIIEIKPQQQPDMTRLSKNQKKKLKKQQKQNQKMQQQLTHQQFNGGGQETNPVSNNLSDEEDFGIADFGADADDIFEMNIPPRGNSQIPSQNTSMNKGIPNSNMGRGGGFAGGNMMGNASPFARNIMINGQNGMQGGGYQSKF